MSKKNATTATTATTVVVTLNSNDNGEMETPQARRLSDDQIFEYCNKLGAGLAAAPSQIEYGATQVARRALEKMRGDNSCDGACDFLTSVWSLVKNSTFRSLCHKYLSWLLYGAVSERRGAARQIIKGVRKILLIQQDIVFPVMDIAPNWEEVRIREANDMPSQSCLAFHKAELPKIVQIRALIKRLAKLATEEIIIREYRALQHK